jgi:hypothetical protein
MRLKEKDFAIETIQEQFHSLDESAYIITIFNPEIELPLTPPLYVFLLFNIKYPFIYNDM